MGGAVWGLLINQKQGRSTALAGQIYAVMQQFVFFNDVAKWYFQFILAVSRQHRKDLRNIRRCLLEGGPHHSIKTELHHVRQK